MTLFEFDAAQKCPCLCGVDEAGRGPLAGDVYAAAVILPPDIEIAGLNDSKKLSEKKREQLYEEITAQALAYHVGIATLAEIEQTNILKATLLAMQRAVEGLSIDPLMVLVDGNAPPTLPYHTKCLVKGDATSAAIAAASIVAKVSRDRYMLGLAEQYPQYGFEHHKGYGTKEHFARISEYGISPVHRASFLKKHTRKQLEDHAEQIAFTQSATSRVGNEGEDFACRYLTQQGYTILDRNYHTALGEVDIIAHLPAKAGGGILSFVEVKTRALGAMMEPQMAVTPHKQHKIKLAAMQYLLDHPAEGQPRFDVCEILIMQDHRMMVRFLPDAFS